MGKRSKRANSGKKSDISDVEEFLNRKTLEALKGGKINDRPDDALFYVDKGKESRIERKLAAKNKTLHVDKILQPNPYVSVLGEGKVLTKPKANTKKRKREQSVYESKKVQVLAKRMKKRPEECREKMAVKTAAEFDLWDAPTAKPIDQFVGEPLAKRPKKYYKEKVSVPRPAIPSVAVPLAGASYNPNFEEHQDLLGIANAVEVRKARERKEVEAYKKTKQTKHRRTAPADPSTMKVDEVDESVSESEESKSDVGGEIDKAKAIAKAEKKKTRAQRNKQEKHAERLEKQRKLKEQRKLAAQINHAPVLLKELALDQKVQQNRQIMKAHKADLDKTRTKRVGKERYTEPAMEVLLTDEVPSSLRTLKPQGAVVRDRMDSIVRRNLVEVTKKRKKSNARNVKEYERHWAKSFDIDKA